MRPLPFDFIAQMMVGALFAIDDIKEERTMYIGGGLLLVIVVIILLVWVF